VSNNDLTLWSDPMFTELVRVVRQIHCDSYKEHVKNINTVVITHTHTHTNTYVTHYIFTLVYIYIYVYLMYS